MTLQEFVYAEVKRLNAFAAYYADQQRRIGLAAYPAEMDDHADWVQELQSYGWPETGDV